jgi:hypothetical protein
VRVPSTPPNYPYKSRTYEKPDKQLSGFFVFWRQSMLCVFFEMQFFRRPRTCPIPKRQGQVRIRSNLTQVVTLADFYAVVSQDGVNSSDVKIDIGHSVVK